MSCPSGFPEMAASRPVADVAAFAAFLELSPDAMVVVDENGWIVAASRRAADLFGYGPHELIGEAVEVLVPMRSRDTHRAERRGYQHSPDPRPMRAGAGRRRDGTEFPAEISLAPVATADGGRFVCAAIRDISAWRDMQAELNRRSLHDPLTGLPNRALLVDRARQVVGRSQRDGSFVAVMYIGLDRFQAVNDGIGHAGGDAVLCGVAGRLCTMVRPSDTVARVGDDEFVVVCDVTGAGEAAGVAQRVGEVFNAPFVTESGEVFLTATVGVAIGHGDPDGLVRDAHLAMFRAKDAGRGRWEFYDSAMRSDAQRRLETHTALHHALSRGELRLDYQPVVEACSGELQSVEALVRWQHPDRGRLGPAEFVGLAEETGLIVPVGGWVLNEALTQLARWRAELGIGDLSISVNLSAAQIRQPDLFDLTVTSLGAADVEPQALCLEITESALVADLAGGHSRLARLREIGVSLAIDDFGTGYSSLTYLKKLPVDSVKIDREFVAGLGVDAYDSAIVAAIIDLAHTLDLTVVAEGVETTAQHSLLRSLGCDRIQGFEVAEPLNAADFTAALTSGRLAPGRTPPRPRTQPTHDAHALRFRVVGGSAT